MLNSNNMFFSIFNKLIDLVLLNLLFLVSCIPVFTIGTSLCSLYYVSLHLSQNTESYLFRSYLAAWKSNFKKGTIIWVFSLLLIFMFRVNLTAIPLMAEGMLRSFMYCIQVSAILVLYAVLQYYFPLTASFENSIGNTLKNSFVLAFRYLPRTLSCLCLTVLPTALIFFVPKLSGITLLVMILIGFSGIAYLESFLFHGIFEALAGLPNTPNE